MSEIKIDQLSISYADGTQALEKVDLLIPNHSRTAIVGPNGAGKTSLFQALSGLIDFEGDILFNDTQMSPSSAESLRKTMSYVFQNPDEMLFMPTVIEDVCFGLETLGIDDQSIHQRGTAALERVALNGFEHRSAHHLSYGERRRVCLAIALARESDLILFDEPTRELDPHGRRNFIDLFHTLDATTLLATHDLELVLETCDDMVLLDGGKLISQGNPRVLLSDPQLMTAHRLEVPHSLMGHPHAHGSTGIILDKS